MDENKEVTVVPSSIRLPQDEVSLIACPRPFSTQRIMCQRPAGGTVADHMRAIGMSPGSQFARVFIDDRLILKAEWEYATPKAGQMVTVRAVPTGGGEGGKDILRTVAQIGIILASIAVTVVTGNPFLGLAVQIGGSLLVNGLIPSPLPRRRHIPIGFEERSRKEAA